MCFHIIPSQFWHLKAMTETDDSMGEVLITIIITLDLPYLQRLKGQNYCQESQTKKGYLRRSSGTCVISCPEDDIGLILPHILPSLPHHTHCTSLKLFVWSSFQLPGFTCSSLGYEPQTSCAWSHQGRERDHQIHTAGDVLTLKRASQATTCQVKLQNGRG